jgi:parvulin-like peptidyl-prolyl isomerase
VVLAQVDDAKLTLDELREAFPAEYEKVLPREQYLDVIQRWIDDEAVYQQALKSNLDEDPQVKRKLQRLQRRMIIEEFLAREVGSNIETEPDEGAMTRYYENNKSDFLRKSPEYRYLQIRVATLKEALAVRAKVRGDNFASLLSKNSLDSAPEFLEPPFRKTSEVPACLHDVLDANPGWVSNPISCPDGVYLIRLLGRIEAGTPLPFPEVRASIAARLSMQHKEKMRESKIRQYKEGVTINLNIDQIPGQDGTDAPPMNEAADSDATGDDERLPPGE